MNCTLEEITLAVTQCQAGYNIDENFRTIFDCNYGMVFGFLKKQKGLKAEDCEELTQEVFLRVYKNLKDFRHESELATWLWRIMYRVFLDYLRRQRLTNQVGHAIPVTLENFNEEHEQLAMDIVDLSLGSNPEKMTLDQEFKRFCREALNSLPDRMRRCMLFCLQGYTHQQIADLLGLSNRGTVSKQIFDARAKIRAYLKQRYGDSFPDEL